MYKSIKMHKSVGVDTKNVKYVRARALDLMMFQYFPAEMQLQGRKQHINVLFQFISAFEIKLRLWVNFSQSSLVDNSTR